MLRTFDLIEDGDSVILERDAALTVTVGQELVPAVTVAADALPGDEHGRRARERPVELGLTAQLIQERRLPRCRKVGLVDQTLAGSHLKRARAPTTNRRFTPGRLAASMIDRVPVPRSSFPRTQRADHRVMSRNQSCKLRGLGSVAPRHPELGMRRQPVRVADDRRNFVPTVEALRQDLGSDQAGATDDRDPHDTFSLMAGAVRVPLSVVGIQSRIG